ncbi:C_GCAxxG_C_C family protein [Clostridioides difficile]|nr:C_GCAxxG_C_C family protein [Clostridioides difficile]
MEYITNRVHELYWKDDVNCARTMLICLSELFHVEVCKQTICAAIGLHGAGGYRAQCGLVEGGLLFIGVYYDSLGKSEDEIVSACYNYASSFEKKFGSLSCFDLRPTGFTVKDPPHMCEKLTCEAVEFAYQFIENAVKL